jgi:hypothetical protein
LGLRVDAQIGVRNETGARDDDRCDALATGGDLAGMAFEPGPAPGSGTTPVIELPG